MKEHDIVEVNKSLCENELVEHDFIGTVVSLHTKHDVAEVKDQDNNVFTVTIASLAPSKEV